MEQDQAERDYLNQLYRQIFEDDKRGVRIFEDLHDRFVKRPSPTDFTQEGMLKAFVQTHQREVLEYIARRIGAAHSAPETKPEENDHD